MSQLTQIQLSKPSGYTQNQNNNNVGNQKHVNKNSEDYGQILRMLMMQAATIEQLV